MNIAWPANYIFQGIDMNGFVEGLWFLAAVGVVGFFVYLRLRKNNELQSWLTKHGMNLDYQYGNVLGIDSKAGKAFIYTDAAWILLPGDVRSIEKSSLRETKYNVWGKGFHKNKECQLVLHTKSMSSPIHVIGFNAKTDMDLWYSRLGLFFKLA